MRLLHTITMQLTEFFGDIPDYVILSHRWRDGEVTFDDIHQPHAPIMQGYQKVRNACIQAARDGFEYIWIDTCCIDKRSSTELSEAINSMWKWYWKASICYAYLDDVPGIDSADKSYQLHSFKESTWFTRGWTLQELLAPAVVEFYSSDWALFGTKSSLLEIVSSVTRVPSSALISRQNIALATVAQKLSWAASRQTKKEEDTAYCLLGLLDVSMPLIYGEGRKAFYRLQRQLMESSNEHTLFAWEATALDISD
ncbi:HET-domain-containing protein [Corynespora cassiicola Philippines]|uniref:HET-domain-containing protein n=1 Tax=Corynespora cassiicola Philippines TaxID=1448308 RepID=A0A2T2NZC4_CORCC|nr:HET-domain-containing protein [Corynespora cassiicola Philippines]